MEEKQIKKWEKTRAKGVIIFVIRYALILSVAITISNLLFNYYWDGIWKTDDIVSNFIIYLVCGIISGWISYKMNENDYQETLNTKR